MRAAIALAALLAGCAGTARVDVGLGYADTWDNKAYQWEGDNPAFLLRVSDRFGRDDRYGCEYQHVSGLTSGWPFNEEPESSLDFVGCTMAFKLGSDDE